MKIHNAGKAAMFGDVPEGSCFAFRRHDVTYVAIKLTNGQTFAVLWPYHPNIDTLKSGLMANSVLHGEALWLLEDALATPKSGVEHLRSSMETRHEIGSLALGAISIFVTTHYKDGDVAWVNLQTGDLVYNAPSPAIWFREWEIHLPNIDGSYQMFCTVPGPQPKRP